MLYQNEIVYRPPLEAESVLLEVTVGCTYGKCTFCQSSRPDRGFYAIPLETVEENARLLGDTPSEQNRDGCFLLGDNVLALPLSYLKTVFGFVHAYLPKVEQISLYARGEDVLKKGWPDLLELKELGLSDIYMGLESGSDQILRQCKKGETAAQLREACQLLETVEIPFHLSSILGLGGAALWQEHALETARFYNRVSPASIRVLTLTPEPGTLLEQQVREGTFQPLSPVQVLREEYALLEALSPPCRCLFAGAHITNHVPIAGFLPEHKAPMLEQLRQALANPNADALEPKRPDYM